MEESLATQFLEELLDKKVNLASAMARVGLEGFLAAYTTWLREKGLLPPK